MVGPGPRGQANGEADVAFGQDSVLPNMAERFPASELHEPSLTAPSWRVRRHVGFVVAGAVVVGSLAEEGSTDAHDGRALLDGDVEVGCHPHRKLGAQLRPVGPQPPRQAPQGPKRRASLVGSLRQPPDRHEPTYIEPGQLEDLIQLAPESVGLEAGLGDILVDVDLEEDWNRGVGADVRGEAVEAPRQLARVDRLDDLERLQRPTGLVRLEGPDEMPRRTRHERCLGLAFLDTVLRKNGQAGLDGCDEPFHGDGLRDGNEGDVSRIAPDPCTGVGDPVENALSRCRNGSDLVGIRSRWVRQRDLLTS